MLFRARDVREAGEAALGRLDWRPLRAKDDPTDLPDAVGRMMTVGDDDANAAYYRVENLIFHNRHSGLDLTQAAEPVAALVLTAIRSGSWTPGGLVHGFDMLVEIVMGEPDAIERARGNTRLVERCRAVVRAALPELYALIARDEERILQGVIDLAAELEPDVGRRRWVYETRRFAAGSAGGWCSTVCAGSNRPWIRHLGRRRPTAPPRGRGLRATRPAPVPPHRTGAGRDHPAAPTPPPPPGGRQLPSGTG